MTYSFSGFGKRLENARKSKDLGQIDLAKALNLKDYKRISAFENEKAIPTLEQAEILAKTVGKRLPEILFAEEQRADPLLNRIIAVWGSLDEQERGTVANVAESLARSKLLDDSADPLAKSKKANT